MMGVDVQRFMGFDAKFDHVFLVKIVSTRAAVQVSRDITTIGLAFH